MKKLTVVMLLLAMAIIILSSCNNNGKIYTEDEYNIILAERDELIGELDEKQMREEELIKELDESRIKESEYNNILNEKDEMLKKLNELWSDEISGNSADIAEPAGNVETERKFLIDVNNLPRELMRIAAIFEFTQTYINYSPEIRIRAVTGYVNNFTMTIKVPLDDIGLSRQEIEFFISEDEYNELLKKQVGNTIYKTRYQFWAENHYIAVDVYSKDLEGLAVAEFEFKSVEEANAYKPPEWFVKDITSDKRYKNANLSKDGLPK